MKKELQALEIPNRRQWRKWLEENHASSPGVWLVFHKAQTLQKSIPYEDTIREALCFGWVDSLVKRLDDERYARKFTPRKPASRWSTINRRRYEDLKAQGLLATPGQDRPPTDRSGDAPRPQATPAYIEDEWKANQPAWNNFEKLAPSDRRAYIMWIDSAKRQETKEKRLREAISLLVAGKKLGLK